MRVVQTDGLSYKLSDDGTYYDGRTPDEVVTMLEACRKDRRAVILSFGDRVTGRQWLDDNDLAGRVGRSMGPIKVPLLIKNGSMGGAAILDYCLVRIRIRKTDIALWTHPSWSLPDFHWQLTEDKDIAKGLPLEVKADGNVVARFKGLKDAKKWSNLIGTSLVVPANYGKVVA